MGRVRIVHGVSPQQEQFLRSSAKYRLALGGIGSGKTRAGALACLMAPPGSKGMVLAPTFDMLELATKDTFLEIAGPSVARIRESSPMTVWLTNGTTIFWRSADKPRNLRGPSLDWFWLDEWAFMRPEVWNVMIGRLRRSSGARGWATTSPNGFNHVYDLFGKELRPGFELVRMPTRSNPYLPADYVSDLEQQYTSALARQELGGEFVDLGDSPVQREWIHERPVPPGVVVTVGVDLAISTRTSADYTALVAVAHEANGHRHVIGAVRLRRGFHGVIDAIKAFCAMYRPVAVYVESVQYQAAVSQELLRGTALPVIPITPDRDKFTRFMPVAARYEHGFLSHAPNLPSEFTDEIISFPNGLNDDYCDALGLALHGDLSTPLPLVA